MYAIRSYYENKHWVFFDWFVKYKEQVVKFRKQALDNEWTDELLQSLVKDVDNGISGLRQGNFNWEEFENIKSNWSEIQPVIHNIAKNNQITKQEYQEIVRFIGEQTRITSYNVCYTKLLRKPKGLDLLFPQAKNRITSYNVCYTKLLRSTVILSIGLVALVRQNNDWIIEIGFTETHGLIVFAISFIFLIYKLMDEIVITSYSIHYTKLYDGTFNLAVKQL